MEIDLIYVKSGLYTTFNLDHVVKGLRHLALSGLVVCGWVGGWVGGVSLCVNICISSSMKKSSVFCAFYKEFNE